MDQFYSLTLLLFMTLGLLISISKWIGFDLLRKKRELYEDKKNRFSKLLFNCWDWKTANNDYEASELKIAFKTEIKVNLDEERIRQIIG